MTRHEFHNRLRSLRCIETSDIGGLSDQQAKAFLKNPERFFVRCDDETAERIWQAIEKRQRPVHHDTHA